MKCPKCGYLGFEQVDRCRNCGYEFLLTPSRDLPELPMRTGHGDDPNPLEDLALVDAAVPMRRPEHLEDLSTHGARSAGRATTGPTPELPLFGAVNDDVPLITRASAPRTPLSVRRATEVPRVRNDARAPGVSPMLDLDEPELESAPPRARVPPARLRETRWTRTANSEEVQAASLVARVLAVAIDVLVLAVVDIVIVYFTMKICGLTTEDLGILPKGPLIAFLLVQNGGYLVAFTAGGQTLGKKAAGIRVVSAEPDGTVDLGHSVVRTLVWVALAIPAGLGFLTALSSRDGRGLHDRCAGTRVVRAAA
jgi:uncharacterized RDD family membrane protein YckC